jgi:hypothetical protein
MTNAVGPRSAGARSSTPAGAWRVSSPTSIKTLAALSPAEEAHILKRPLYIDFDMVHVLVHLLL